ncbi:MAG TPA: hypothetical protein GX403_04785 [Rhodocyclaceae bacterium]|nr:hypothetical protein [Rhodocyclaceae bacterium]
MRRPPLSPLRTLATLLAVVSMTTGCEQIADALELPNPSRDAARLESEGRAIGSACRHAGRSLEDCYTLNASAAKAAVFAGWRDMNDYMMEHKLEVVPSRLTPGAPKAPEAAAASASTPATSAH